ncbi:MAG: ABC transporter permease [Chloroflexi bacterium CFX4]|nr:ABC transporter permease [Chloroflexi bacterium CFX4]MDL1922688.1 ABC transporter permease [Chloroflexi bacterium CFX3]
MLGRLPLAWAGRLAVRRLSAQWRSLLTVIVGTLLSAAVGALIPLYLTTVAQVSMVERFSQLPLEDVHAAASLALIPNQRLPQPLADAIRSYDAQFRTLAAAHFDNFPAWLSRTAFYAETSALAINPPPEAGETRIPDPTLRAFLAYHEGWTDALTLIEGSLPRSLSDDPDADLEIVIPFEAQNALGFQVGEILALDQGGPRGGWASSRNIRARIVGVVAQAENLPPAQRAYFMNPSPLRYAETSGEYRAEFVALTTRDSLLRAAAEFIPDTPTRFGWRLLFDHARLPFSRSPEARSALLDYDNALAEAFRQAEDGTPLQLVRYTRLINWQLQSDQTVDNGVLLAYERAIRSLDAPFTLLLLQVGALVIFFLLVTAALVRRGERREIAMLQSRGAADGALIIVRGFEALVLCLISAALAPFLAQQLLIAITPFFANYPDLPLILTADAFLFAAVAAGVAFLALIATLRPVLRLPLIAAGGVAQRGEKQAWWQRYYLDVILAVLGMAALLRLVSRESPLFTTTAGGNATDPFLLLAPALLFLGLGSVLLRVFPLLAALAARLLAVGRGAVGALGAWQLAREPIHYGRITFLLALAIGIGWFATSFRATVDRSQADQAQYRVGADLRATERDLRLNAGRALPAESYTAAPEVAAASVAWRLRALNFQPDASRAALNGQLLAVDSATFAASVHWRADLGDLRLPSAPEAALALPQVGEVLPFVPQTLRLWARFDVWTGFMHVPDLDRLLRRTTLYVRLQDADGIWLQVPFRAVETEYTRTGSGRAGLEGGDSFYANGWALLEADIAALDYVPQAPLRLVSLYWQHRGRSNNGERFLRLYLTDFSGTDTAGTRHTLSFLNEGAWQFAYDSGAQTRGDATPDSSDGRRGLGIMWDQAAESARMGILLNYPEPAPVPLIASSSLVDRLGLQAGQLLTVRNILGVDVQFRLGDAPQAYYPTLYDSYQRDGAWVQDRQFMPFAVAERDLLLYALNRRPSAALYPDEVWLKAAEGVTDSALVAALQPRTERVWLRLQTLEGERQTLQTDPLARGLLGLMFTQFIVALALSIVGLLTYTALTAAARRAEFGVLRALGLPAQRVIGQLAFEQLFVIALGVLLGAALGAVLSSQVVPRLAQDASGAQITPPFIVQVETAALLQYGAIIGVVLIAVLAVSALLVRRLSLAQTLRLGED